MATVHVTGGKEINQNLELQKDAMKSKVLAGMINAARLIKRAVTKVDLPTTPVDISNLRASFFITTIIGIKAGASPTFLTEKGDSKLTPKQFAELETHHASSVATASAEVRTATNLTLIMGYGANYAIWVHEMTDPGVEWSKPGSGPKWFEKSLKGHRDDMLKEIGRSARITQIKGFAATRTSAANTETEEV